MTPTRLTAANLVPRIPVFLAWLLITGCQMGKLADAPFPSKSGQPAAAGEWLCEMDLSSSDSSRWDCEEHSDIYSARPSERFPLVPPATATPTRTTAGQTARPTRRPSTPAPAPRAPAAPPKPMAATAAPVPAQPPRPTRPPTRAANAPQTRADPVAQARATGPTAAAGQSRGQSRRQAGGQAAGPSGSQRPGSTGTVGIEDLPPDYYTIQFAAFQKWDQFERYANTHALKGITAARVKSRGRLFFVVLFGFFETAAEARERLAQLPDTIAKDKVWIRRIGSLQESMRAAAEHPPSDEGPGPP